MAKKTSNKTKSAVKPTTQDVPVVVSDIRNIAGDLGRITTLPDNLKAGRDKIVASINRFATRVENSSNAAVKAAAKEKAKAEREAKKAEREKAKKAKAEKKVAALREQLAKLTKELES